jgi:hypothetical protein
MYTIDQNRRSARVRLGYAVMIDPPEVIGCFRIAYGLPNPLLDTAIAANALAYSARRRRFCQRSFFAEFLPDLEDGVGEIRSCGLIGVAVLCAGEPAARGRRPPGG